MTIAISSGHGKKVRGAKSVLDEVDEARRVTAEVARVLTASKVKVATFNEDNATTVSANLNAIVSWHKKQTRSLDVSVHFNAFKKTDKAMGVEVCYKSQQSIAARTSNAIAVAGKLINRGSKKRTNLYFLNNLPTSILLEVAFVDSTEDARLYNQNFSKICAAIAETIGGITAPPPEPPPPTGRPVVKRGDKNAYVASIQRSLGLPADSDFGPTTEAGVKALQRAHGAGADGIVGAVTWRLLDELDLRIEDGDDGIAEDLEGAIDQAVMRSGVDQIQWPNRGKAPSGYYLGMAKTFGLVVERYLKGDGAATIMAQAETGDASKDALFFLRTDFLAKGMHNNVAGLDTLRHLFVLLVGLGLRETTGNHWKGKGAPPSTGVHDTADTCEAGLFQSSWNLSTASNEISRLFEEYRVDPNGFRDSFSIGVSPTAKDLETYGTGIGTYYQFLAKFCPAFAVLMTGVGLRLRRQHWGPVNRREVTLDSRIHDLLKDVQQLVEGWEPGEPEGPEEPELPQQPEPGAAAVALNIAVDGDVVVKVPDNVESEPSDARPEVEIIVKAKGSVAVSVNVGNTVDVADHALIGKVRHDL